MYLTALREFKPFNRSGCNLDASKRVRTAVVRLFCEYFLKFQSGYTLHALTGLYSNLLRINGYTTESLLLLCVILHIFCKIYRFSCFLVKIPARVTRVTLKINHPFLFLPQAPWSDKNRKIAKNSSLQRLLTVLKPWKRQFLYHWKVRDCKNVKIRLKSCC